MIGSPGSAFDPIANLEDHKKKVISTQEEKEVVDEAAATLLLENIEMKKGSTKMNGIFVWLVENTQFLRASETTRLFSLNKAFSKIDNNAFWKIRAKYTYPLNKVLKAVKEGRTWKQYYQRCFKLFGQDGELNFVQIIGIAKDIRAWMKANAPMIYETLNDGADITLLSSHLKRRGFQNRGHLAFWTEINGQNTFGEYNLRQSAIEHGFFGGFDLYNWKGIMHLIPVDLILASNKRPGLDNRICIHMAWGGRGVLTVEQFAAICKGGSMRKARPGTQSICYPQGGGTFMGFMKWYRDALYENTFRVKRCGAIDRLPRNNNQGSETITNGLRIRVTTLYVPEMENGPWVTMIYQFEFDCAPGHEPPVGILESKQFWIGEDDDIKCVNTPGVIGLYPNICPNMEVFRYNSCTRFSRYSKSCWMEGSFLFRSTSGGEFRAYFNRFYFQWWKSPIV